APKYGCGQGTCGVCTVLIDGEAHLSCLTLAAACEGRTIETASGMADGPDLHPLQAAFMEQFAAQCGFCTPGMLLAAVLLLQREPCPDRERIRRELIGNLCRCTGYSKILDAVEEYAVQAAGRSGTDG
ncbi:MAG TPA: (2Fe-2S)-binding protein, partial [Actinomycetota bacterium]